MSKKISTQRTPNDRQNLERDGKSADPLPHSGGERENVLRPSDELSRPLDHGGEAAGDVSGEQGTGPAEGTQASHIRSGSGAGDGKQVEVCSDYITADLRPAGDIWRDMDSQERAELMRAHSEWTYSEVLYGEFWQLPVSVKRAIYDAMPKAVPLYPPGTLHVLNTLNEEQMKQFGFTPGPWHFDREELEVVQSASGGSIAAIRHPEDSPCISEEDDAYASMASECEANGHLMAAAPDLLATAKEYLKAVRFRLDAQHAFRSDDSDENQRFYALSIDSLRFAERDLMAAISKAGGAV